MNKLESIDTPFEFDSPVEFVLIATVGKKRSVVAKSKGAQMDLIAYAQKNLEDEEYGSLLMFPFPFPTQRQLKPLSADSLPSRHIKDENYDSRRSECTIVWRGAAFTRHRRKIEKEFEARTLDIIDALDERSSSRLEWSLASVVDQCNRATSYIKRKRLRFVYAFWFVMIIYAIGIGAFLINRSITH